MNVGGQLRAASLSESHMPLPNPQKVPLLRAGVRGRESAIAQVFVAQGVTSISHPASPDTSATQYQGPPRVLGTLC